MSEGGPPKGANVKVICRVRPPNKLELASGGVNCVTLIDQQNVAVKVQDSENKFCFDRVFAKDTPQQEIYDFGAKDTISDVLQGYNGTVFAYGQTGSGKTHTMEGDIFDPVGRGLIPRMVSALFEGVEKADENVEFTVKVSMIEIYLEKIRDLLNPSHDNLAVHEDKVRGVWVQGATEEYVGCEEDVWDLLRRGQSNRAIAATRMNEGSSRSHSLFICTITQKNTKDLSVKTGKLFLVDLAGSEKVGKTGAEGQQLEEAKNINKSLSALGNVINALTDGKSTHVPYRDSKLTRILQDSLGGNSRTTLVITCSPSSYNDAETLGTMRFGMRAKTIKNKPKINRELSVAELKLQINTNEKEIERLKGKIVLLEGEVKLLRSGGVSVGGGEGGGDASGLVAKYQQRNDELQAKVTEQEEQLKTSTERLEELQEMQDTLLDQLAEKDLELNVSQDHLEEARKGLTEMAEREMSISKENELLLVKITEMTFSQEKKDFEHREMQLNAESLTADNESLKMQVADLQAALQKAHSEKPKGGGAEAPSAGRNQLVAAQMQQWNQKEDHLRAELQDNKASISRIESRMDELDGVARGQKYEAMEAAVAATTSENEELKSQTESLKNKIAALEAQVASVTESLEQERAARVSAQVQDPTQLADEALLQGSTEILRQNLQLLQAQKRAAEQQLQQMREKSASQGESLRGEILALKEKIHHLEATQQDHTSAQAKSKTATDSLEQQLSDLQVKSAEERKVLQTELQVITDKSQRTHSEFEALRAALMRDLQNRCEKVIDLEMALDDAREQLNQERKGTSTKTMRKKMKDLERNLEQLGAANQQLIGANNQLCRENQLAEKKLVQYKERIHTLELLLQDATDKLQRTTTSHQQEMARMMATLEQQQQQTHVANAARQRGPGTPLVNQHVSHVVKPKVLRGGSRAFMDTKLAAQAAAQYSAAHGADDEEEALPGTPQIYTTPSPAPPPRQSPAAPTAGISPQPQPGLSRRHSSGFFDRIVNAFASKPPKSPSSENRVIGTPEPATDKPS
eukprot:TRINITY_DN3445_c0_g2_i1.p1 TRINITY_DN3445_c0_g2~~TRINITY_DN3445_c0_g2_i1.p1  ORF type:complete len:1035 (+),score=285.48 TRINITY_DN3445_c0_g2_i1:57-3161(+)